MSSAFARGAAVRYESGPGVRKHSEACTPDSRQAKSEARMSLPKNPLTWPGFTQDELDRLPEGVEARFWPKVRKSGPGECWEWTASLSGSGYGQLGDKSLGRQRMLLAHRISYQINVGPIPTGLLILHSCDNRICVNPAHLRPGTYAENTRDIFDRNRWSRTPKTDLETAEQIARLRESGVTFRAIQDQYGIGRRAVRGALQRVAERGDL